MFLYLFRGGVLLTVKGNNFDSVAKPLMRVQIKYNKTDDQHTYPLWTTPEVRSFTYNTFMLILPALDTVFSQDYV